MFIAISSSEAILGTNLIVHNWFKSIYWSKPEELYLITTRNVTKPHHLKHILRFKIDGP